MLEVNDFNAVRISLASPEQIKSWSYGEVTKPETINYRTLKPEKDGLFCEKIFGPTKDFECYCGKYKRVRYKGVICDKCGVEVARAKVRRERMGHIQLASPVSHIWFVKGTPSRLGLLLDISPRSLERVLYFAQYIVTWVDEEGKQRLIQQIQEDASAQSEQVAAPLRERLAALEAELAEYQAELNERVAAERRAIEQDAGVSRKTIETEYSEVVEKLQAHLNQASPEDIFFRHERIAVQDEKINEEDLERVRELYDRAIDELEAETAARIERAEAAAAADFEVRQSQAQSERDQIQRQLDAERDRVKATVQEQVEELEDLKPVQLLTEAKYRELRDKYGTIFRAGMGAEAVREIVANLDIEKLREDLRAEVNSTSGQRRKKATKRLRVVEAFRKSGNRPEWMILTVLPVLPPDLRPMVQLDGGRFATSDLNDLYRRVINRNNRLRRLMELNAPEIIIRNEKRMLQEAVDSLIDNGRRGRAVSGSSNHKLKSLSDMLKGKQGRFRQNLLGKRVDYSGRSVIVVGPDLKLHQCGLPKRMALELFKPFVMRRLVERGYAHNIKSAKRIVERVKPEVWDVLEEVIEGRPVLLNRAPTLHRLGIQAFMPVLIEGSAIQLHPLVCSAFNADFDGDQMAVHVPLSASAVEEARNLMLSTNNLLSPSSGEPIVAPTLDMVLGCYYLTLMREPEDGREPRRVASFEDARLLHELDQISLHEPIRVRLPEALRREGDPAEVTTTVGRIIFSEILPPALGFKNEVMDKKALKKVVAQAYRELGNEATAEIADHIKRLGFHYATKSGITIAVSDIRIPIGKEELLSEADRRIADIERQFRRGLITEEERYNSAVEIWSETTDLVADRVSRELDRFGPIYMMATSGAKGNISQIRQMAGMRGLMTDPSGRIIDLPIRSSFLEGLSVLEYFISTHGARKGLADTALRTADSGYLTRRLIDVSQDVIINDEDCETQSGIWEEDAPGQEMLAPFADRITGRIAAMDVVHPETGEIIVARNEEIDEDRARAIVDAEIKRAYVRSPLTCQSRRGLCRMCYGRSLARGKLVEIGEAVGIIAAQSIGEPGTQLTMRTFHTGGVAGSKLFRESDITSGLPRVEELFEARVPKGQAIISEIDGVVEVIRTEEARKVKVVSVETYREEHEIPADYSMLVREDEWVEIGTPLARSAKEIERLRAEGDEQALVPIDGDVVAGLSGRVMMDGGKLVVFYEEREEREYPVPALARIKVETGDRVKAGDQITEGSVNPQDLLRILGRERVQQYLVQEVQKVYRSQGVNINDKHIEVIVRQMLRKVRVDTPGDTELLPGELVDRFAYEEINAKVLAEGGEPATAQTVLLGVTKASLNTDSFLAAASFQETTRVLTEAAVEGKIDRLVGLKENVIIGKLIPAGSGLQARRAKKAALPELPDLPELEDGDQNGLAGASFLDTPLTP